MGGLAGGEVNHEQVNRRRLRRGLNRCEPPVGEERDGEKGSRSSLIVARRPECRGVPPAHTSFAVPSGNQPSVRADRNRLRAVPQFADHANRLR
jgi:hypothetical protein